MEEQVEMLTRTNGHGFPIAFVPTPTKEYRTHRKAKKLTVEPGLPMPIPIPIPIPLLIGPRVLMWKQDPSVSEMEQCSEH